MPNHIKNEVTIYAEDKETLIEIEGQYRYEREEGEDYRLHWPDFNKIIPMPDDDDFIRGNLSMEAQRASNGWNWYDWSIKNWGTKWNSYSHDRWPVELEWDRKLWHTTYTFETAWSSVPELIRLISEEHPDITIKYRYADEDMGYNCGTVVFKNGVIVEEFIPEGGSKEAYELAFELWPDRDHYKWDEEEETYVYDEEAEVW